MADPVVLYGPTFGDELQDAGLGGIPISWSAYEIFGREDLTAEQNTELDAVIAAHDPTKQRKSICTADEFVSRWTNQEYLSLLKYRANQIAQNKIGEAKRWDELCGGDVIDLNKKKAITLRDNLVTAGVITAARADVIFA